MSFIITFTKEGLELAIELVPDLAEKTEYYLPYQTDGQLVKEKEGDKMFVIKFYPNEYNGISVARIGYKLDDETQGRTYVSYWHSALELFKQLVNAGSEYDLMLKLHVFLQKIQYYTPCTHVEPNGGVCRGGIINTTKKKCSKCHGTGKDIATSTQDVILLQLPDEENQGTALKPSDLAFYVDVPTKTVELYKGIIDESPSLICESIFGVDISQIPNNSSTATENRNAYDTAQDTLHEFTKSPVKMFNFIVNDIAKTLGYEKLTGDLVYPNEYDLETEYELLTKLKLAKDAAAPPEVIQRLNERIFIKQNRTESNAMLIYNEMRKFQPFGAVGKDLRAAIVQALPDASPQKALFLNFKEITDAIIAKDSKRFLMAKYDLKKEIVDDYSRRYADEAVKANTVKGMQPLEIEIDA